MLGGRILAARLISYSLRLDYKLSGALSLKTDKIQVIERRRTNYYHGRL